MARRRSPSSIPTGASSGSNAAGQNEIKANIAVKVTAPMVKVTRPMSTFSGDRQCETMIADSFVISPAYTPGVGNCCERVRLRGALVRPGSAANSACATRGRCVRASRCMTRPRFVSRLTGGSARLARVTGADDRWSYPVPVTPPRLRRAGSGWPPGNGHQPAAQALPAQPQPLLPGRGGGLLRQSGLAAGWPAPRHRGPVRHAPLAHIGLLATPARPDGWRATCSSIWPRSRRWVSPVRHCPRTPGTCGGPSRVAFEEDNRDLIDQMVVDSAHEGWFTSAPAGWKRLDEASPTTTSRNSPCGACPAGRRTATPPPPGPPGSASSRPTRASIVVHGDQVYAKLDDRAIYQPRCFVPAETGAGT